uniref:Uncharacterized protein n=1 Tax=Vibrio alginolyticus TaxID=663 RepID=A0A6M4NMP7_VIBAL|nr:hypothetical protein [Vibrio alginolyticus]
MFHLQRGCYFSLLFSLLAQWQFTEVSQSYSPIRFLSAVSCFHNQPN